jgi:hypothetical protein
MEVLECATCSFETWHPLVQGNPGGQRMSGRALEPIDRITEVMFGLLMATTFTGSLSVATAGREDARLMSLA